jgi:hypothetical protein
MKGKAWNGFAAIGLAACMVAPVLAAEAEVIDLDPALAAKVAKEKAKGNAAAKVKGKTVTPGASVAGEDECGVNIGNVNTGKSSPGKGIATPRENTVVITGPVINLGKCKK